jgi:hypothetical protein
MVSALIGSVTHLLTKHGACANIAFFEDHRLAKKAEEELRPPSRARLSECAASPRYNAAHPAAARLLNDALT